MLALGLVSLLLFPVIGSSIFAISTKWFSPSQETKHSRPQDLLNLRGGADETKKSSSDKVKGNLNFLLHALTYFCAYQVYVLELIWVQRIHVSLCGRTAELKFAQMNKEIV